MCLSVHAKEALCARESPHRASPPVSPDTGVQSGPDLILHWQPHLWSAGVLGFREPKPDNLPGRKTAVFVPIVQTGKQRWREVTCPRSPRDGSQSVYARLFFQAQLRAQASFTQCAVTIKRTDLGSGSLGLGPGVPKLWFGASQVTSLSLSLFICRMGVTAIITKHHGEDWWDEARIPLQVAKHPIRGSNSTKPHNNNKNGRDDGSNNSTTSDAERYPGPSSVWSLSFVSATLLGEH